MRRLVPMCQNNFNPRSREGSDLTGVQFDLLADRFQSTLPRGERRLLLPDRLLVPPSFQSTLPRGERLTCDGPVLPVRGFQSTLPRGERPVWTRHSGGQAPFQSTLPRGERRRNNIVIPSSSLFQSTLPRGERHEELRQELNMVLISIHAPARGATFRNQHKSLHHLFQSTLPRGERHDIPFMDMGYYPFQSTLPRGERRVYLIVSGVFGVNFNPRSREGSDPATLYPTIPI